MRLGAGRVVLLTHRELILWITGPTPGGSSRITRRGYLGVGPDTGYLLKSLRSELSTASAASRRAGFRDHTAGMTTKKKINIAAVRTQTGVAGLSGQMAGW